MLGGDSMTQNNAAIVFDRTSARRIIDTVQRVEATPDFEAFKTPQRSGYRPGVTLLVKIIAVSISTPGVYTGQVHLRNPDGAIGTYIAATTESCLVYGTGLKIGGVYFGKVIYFDAINDRVEVFVNGDVGRLFYARIDGMPSSNKYSFTEWDGGVVTGGLTGDGSTRYARDVGGFSDPTLAGKYALLIPSGTTNVYNMGPWQKYIDRTIDGTGSGTCSGTTMVVTIGYTDVTRYYIGG